MIVKEDTLYIGDLNKELLVFRFGKNIVPCMIAGGIGYRGLSRVISSNKDNITIEYYHKAIVGKEALRTKTLTMDSIISATGLSEYHVNKLKQDFLDKMVRIEVVEDVRDIAPWASRMTK